MQQYSGWAPKEYKGPEDHVHPEAGVGRAADQGPACNSADRQHNGYATAAGVDPTLQEQQQKRHAPESAANPNGAAAADDTDKGSASSSYVYDCSTGYWYDHSSGLYYDANTGLFYNTTTQQWSAYDAATGQYVPVPSAEESQPQPSPAPAQKANEKKRGAVIGAAPKLNSQGLMAAVHAAEEKERMQKALLAQKQSNAAARKQALAAKASAAKQPSPQAASPAVAVAPAPRAPAAAPAAGPAPAGAAASVQGIIHRGKWSQRQQQLQ